MIRYDINLPNDRLRSYRYVTLFVMMIHVFMFGLLYSKAMPKSTQSNICVMGFTLSLLSLFFIIIQQYKSRLLAYRAEIAFFILSCCWFILGAYWQGAVVMVLAAMGLVTWRKPVVSVTTEGVLYPSFPQKKWNWPELSNIMIRDGVLTIDCRDNRLIQVLIDPDSAASLDETMFNDFCQRHLLPRGI